MMEPGLRAVILVVATLAQHAPAGAQERAQPLSLGEAVASALATHPSVEAATAREARAEAGRREAGATLLPAVSLEAMATRFQEPMVVAPLHGFDPQRPPTFDRSLVQAGATVGYTLWDGGARGARLARTDYEADAARTGVEAARAALLADVVSRYAAVAGVRERQVAHASRVTALTSERDRVARLLEQGRVARVVVLRAEAALSAARAELLTVEVERDVAERELAHVMGVAPSAMAGRELERLMVRGAAPALDAAVESAVGHHPEVRRQRAVRAASHAQVAEAQAQWWPRVLLGGRYVRYASGAGDAGGEWQAGVQLNHALFTAGARPAALDRARADVRGAAADLAQVELRVAEQATRAHAAVMAAASRTVALEAAVAQLEEVVRIDRLTLEAGAGVQTDYLAAEAELLRARASLTDARYGAVVARTELARAMGVLSEAWIDANMESGT